MLGSASTRPRSTAQTANPAAVTYTPAAGFTGTVTLTLTTDDPAGPCGPVSATRTINVSPGPTATAGGPNTVCSSATPAAITLTGSGFGGSATTAAWSITSGGGSLSSTAQTTDPASVTYTPAAGFSGVVTLTLTTDAPVGCTAATAIRTINVNAVTNAGTIGSDQNICNSSGAGVNPAQFISSADATGLGTITYQWQSSTTDCNSGS